MARPIVKMIYNYVFHPFQIQPMVESRVIIEEDVVKTWMGHETLVEKPALQQKRDVAIGIAEVQDKLGSIESQKIEKISSKDNKHSKSYALTYYNPVTDKTEVLITKADIETRDFVQQMIEEASGKESAYAMYSFIAAPILIKQVDPILLQRILDDREYGTPPSFGGAAAVKVVEQIAIPIQVKAEQAKGAVIEALRRKELVEKKLEREIILIKEAVEILRRKETPEEALRKLGPLTRARFLVFLREKRLSIRIIIFLLEKDIGFLQNIKKKLQSMSTADLIDLIKAMKKLREKK